MGLPLVISSLFGMGFLCQLLCGFLLSPALPCTLPHASSCAEVTDDLEIGGELTTHMEMSLNDDAHSETSPVEQPLVLEFQARLRTPQYRSVDKVQSCLVEARIQGCYTREYISKKKTATVMLGA